MKKIVIRALIVVFAAVFVFSGYNVIKILTENKKADNLYTGLQSEYTRPVVPDAKDEEEENPLPISVDFTALKDRNSDIVGWLILPDTVLNYPVVQAANNDKYLRRDLEGKKLTAGTLFADYRCQTVGEDANYIIYGHNMRNGSMFKTVTDYKSQEFFDANPIIYYLTDEKNFKIEPVAGLVVPDNDELYKLNFSNEQMVEYINNSKGKSTFNSKALFTEQDSFITLSTCSKEYKNARFVLIGKLTEVN